ncbi:sulfotransferase [candidate division KSB1 bacterium]|nr:sulfotransferase [candidate division KSB1 bacterium]
MNNYIANYSFIERQLHNIAFSTTSIQIGIADLESRLFSKSLQNIEIRKPVFITALPRAGTTLLLELCAQLDNFVSHSYNDMPFLLTPIIWNSFSRHFKTSSEPRERAHGDGMIINVDNPEAFDEIIWKYFWASHYRKDVIIPWTDSEYPVFEKFIYSHLRKIILIKGERSGEAVRYITKNNLNISRLKYLTQLFPDSIIVIPFRSPLQHATSLLRQHQNFINIHKKDAFTARYMEAIGHYDFGDNLRPVNFNNWFYSRKSTGPESLNFWIEYWVNTYRYLIENIPERCFFFSYDTLCADPQQTLKLFFERLEIHAIDHIERMIKQIRQKSPYPIDLRTIDNSFLIEAEYLFQQLEKMSKIS